MPKRRTRSSELPVIPSTSLGSCFLNLPAELRNLIYEYVVTDEYAVTLRLGEVLYRPISSLSLLCKQVRNEYRSIFVRDVLQYAPCVRHHITNFAYKDTLKTVAYLPESTEDIESGPRRYALIINLTNTFERYLHLQRDLLFGKLGPGGMPTPVDPHRNTSAILPPCRIEWDPRVFDVAYLVQVLARQHWLFTSYKIRHFTQNWEILRNAYDAALRRYGHANLIVDTSTTQPKSATVRAVKSKKSAQKKSGPSSGVRKSKSAKGVQNRSKTTKPKRKFVKR